MMKSISRRRKNFLVIIFMVKVLISELFSSSGSALTINDIDLDKVNATYTEVNAIPLLKPAMFPQPEEVYSTFNIPRYDKISSRQKRFTRLFFPPNSIFVLDTYINLPLLAQGHVFTPLTLEARTFLFMPNITLYNFGSIKRSLSDRLLFFEMAEKFFDNLGYDGKTCLLRALCERSEYHVVTDGIIAEIVTLLLEFTSASGDTAYQEYEEAREFGRSLKNCKEKYSSCSMTIFSWLKNSDDAQQK